MAIFFLLLFYAWMPFLYTNFIRLIAKLIKEGASLTAFVFHWPVATRLGITDKEDGIKIYDIRKEEPYGQQQ